MTSHSDYTDKVESVRRIFTGADKVESKKVFTSDNVTISLSELNIVAKLIAGPFEIPGLGGEGWATSPTIALDSDGELRCWPLGTEEDISFNPTLMFRIMERLGQYGIPF